MVSYVALAVTLATSLASLHAVLHPMALLALLALRRRLARFLGGFKSGATSFFVVCGLTLAVASTTSSASPVLIHILLHGCFHFELGGCRLLGFPDGSASSFVCSCFVFWLAKGLVRTNTSVDHLAWGLVNKVMAGGAPPGPCSSFPVLLT